MKKNPLILFLALFGFMGLSWDASFFWGIILGNGSVTVWEDNLAVAWFEFSALAILSLFFLFVAIRWVFAKK